MHNLKPLAVSLGSSFPPLIDCEGHWKTFNVCVSSVYRRVGFKSIRPQRPTSKWKKCKFFAQKCEAI